MSSNIAFKILGEFNNSIHGGEYHWLPPILRNEGAELKRERFIPGEWTRNIELITMCKQGYHLSTYSGLPMYLEPSNSFVYSTDAKGRMRLYYAEYDVDNYVLSHNKIVTGKARLLMEVDIERVVLLAMSNLLLNFAIFDRITPHSRYLYKLLRDIHSGLVADIGPIIRSDEFKEHKQTATQEFLDHPSLSLMSRDHPGADYFIKNYSLRLSANTFSALSRIEKGSFQLALSILFDIKQHSTYVDYLEDMPNFSIDLFDYYAGYAPLSLRYLVPPVVKPE